MYTTILVLHSWLRWLALGAGIVATAATFRARPGSLTSAAGERPGLLLMVALDIQMLLGLLLYLVLSPFTTLALRDFPAAMRNPALRFWAVEHGPMMLLAVVLVHVGRSLARKAPTPAAGRSRQLLCFALATVCMIAATPWPGTLGGRPLFRL